MSAFGQNAKKIYNSNGIISSAPLIDGKLDEECWKNALWKEDFVQYEPTEGADVTQKTSFAIQFDEHNLYIAVKCFDTNVKNISKINTRRDNIEGDLIVIQIDSYFDKRSAFSFGVSAAGIKMDQFISNDGNEDNSWNAVWYAKTSSDNEGWYAEMQIPLTQLRFEKEGNKVWGLQVGRKIYRNQEVVVWQPATRKANGWVSQYGELRGIESLKPSKTVEIVPYVVAKAETYAKERDNPFREKGYGTFFNVGIDGKLGVTNNMTLDFTINPDFGQVEADPSEVNLSSFETFFSEQRPFFVEGNNIFSYQLALGDGNIGYENLFYSRRIGARPHNSANEEDDEYSKMPEFSRILGAAKLSGKTKSGFSLGLMETLTSAEFAKISGPGSQERNQIVEPMTNFLVGRVQQDYDNGNTMVGGMFTSVNRNINDENLSTMHRSAYSGGVDFVRKWHNKDWEVDFSAYMSRVEGTPEAIAETQGSSAHYFQRSDAPHVEMDSSRRSLTGSGGKFMIGKMGGELKFIFATLWKSPQLELNDAGFMRSADNIFQLSWAGYRMTKQFSIIRKFQANFNQYAQWTFAGENTGRGGNINFNLQFTNYWYIGGGFNIDGSAFSTTLLRGGPSFKMPGSRNMWSYIESNGQKKIVLDLSFNAYTSDIKGLEAGSDYEAGIEYKPFKSLQLKAGCSHSVQMNQLQYVTSCTNNNSEDYILARLDRRTTRGYIRINYNITPDLSMQYWGQPFFTKGNYTNFKKATETKAQNLSDRYHIFDRNEISYNRSDETYSVDQGGSNQSYTFDNPDFNVKVFLSNAVLRWEYKPGSTLYAVWSQNIYTDEDRALFKTTPQNIFLLKFSYRFGR
jgi:hypothetical protein